MRRAIVIGGSVGGLFAANMLLRRGWQVDIYERAAEALATRGAGIAGHRELEAVMAAAGSRIQGNSASGWKAARRSTGWAGRSPMRRIRKS